MNISYEKMLFYNDLLEYQVSIEGKKLDSAFKSNDIELIEKCIDEYYYGRNVDTLHYDNKEEVQKAKDNDRYICNLYKEQN